MIHILQANMHRRKIADELLYQLVFEKKVDLLLLSEQYQDKESPGWFSDLLGRAAIWVPDLGKVPVHVHGAGSGYVWVISGEVTYFSCYFTPNECIHDFQQKLDGLEDALFTKSAVIVTGDFNARAVEWGLPDTNSRGRRIMEMAARTSLIVLNIGSTTTFRRPGCSGTIPDVSFASEDIAPKVQDWYVMEDYTGSDHQYISFRVEDKRYFDAIPQTKPLRWNVSRMEKMKFAEAISRRVNMDDTQVQDEREVVETFVSTTMKIIKEACEISMPCKKPRHQKQPVYWWTPEIAELRKKCLRSRRIAQRARTRSQAEARSADYRAARRALRHAISCSKVRCWRELCDEVDVDPWGRGYKIVTGKLGAMKRPSCLDVTTMERIVGALFPEHPIREDRVFGE